MFIITFVAAFVVCAQAAVLPPVPMLDGKIVGGSVAAITEAPYQVALLFNSGTGSFNHVCGGSIITRNVIITAAHCTDRSTASQWRIRAGSAQHNSGGQVVAVSRYVQHSSFNVLSASVATVTLPSQGMTVADGTSALVTGWGSLSESGSYPTVLYKVYVPIVNQQTCARAYASYNTVTSNMICAGRYGTGGADACQGDSGGPLVISGRLIGITSWGRGCAQAAFPGVWTRVPNFVNWINTNS